MSAEDALFFLDATRRSDAQADAVRGRESPASLSDGGAAWVDDDDCAVAVDLTAGASRRRMRASPDEVRVSGKEYAKRVELLAESIAPRPRWAALPSGRTDEPPSILQDPFSVLARGGAHSALPPDVLGVGRLHRLPVVPSCRFRGGVVSLDAHPSEPWVLSAGADRTLRVHALEKDGSHALMCSVRVPGWDVTSARFTADGSRVVAVGSSSRVIVWELASGSLRVVPRLSGCAEASWTGIAVSGAHVALYSAPGGRSRPSATVALLCARTLQVVGTLAGGSPVCAAAFGPDGESLYVASADGRLCVWSVARLRCVAASSLAVGAAPSALAASPDGRLLAVGSAMGVLDVFSAEAILAGGTPRPLASFMNLTTAVTSAAFHPRGELLVYASGDRDNSLRCVHLASMRVFANWPKQTTPLGRVTRALFGAAGRTLVVGNARGHALVYSLAHYDRVSA